MSSTIESPKSKKTGRPSVDVQQVLKGDRIPPAVSLQARSEYVTAVDTIPVSRYIDPAFHALEVSRMWTRVWQYACWTHDIPNPGDVSVYRNAGQSILIVRQKDGGLKAFPNSCLHRGREICGKSGGFQQLRCPYHGFSWELDGSSKWMPAEWDFAHVDPAKFSLPEVKVSEWNGFIFVNFDPNAMSLEKYLGKFIEQWKEWDFKNKRYRAVTVTKAVNCNWKAVSEAFMEALHVFSTHPELAPFAPATTAQYDTYEDEPHFARFHAIVGKPAPELARESTEQDVLDGFTSSYLSEVYGTDAAKLQSGETARQGLARLSRAAYRDRLGLDVSAMPEAELLDAVQYSVFPNMHVWPSLANPLVYRFFPGATPDVCTWETSLYLPFEGTRPSSGKSFSLTAEQSLAEVAELGLFGPLLQQDTENLKYLQDGLKASVTGVLQLSCYQESGIRHFHKTLQHYVEG